MLIFFTAFSALLHFILGNMLTYPYPENHQLAPYLKVAFYKIENAHDSAKTNSADAVSEKTEPKTVKNIEKNEIHRKKPSKLVKNNKKASPTSTNSIHTKAENKHATKETFKSKLPVSAEHVKRDIKISNTTKEKTKSVDTALQDKKSAYATHSKVTNISWSEEEKRKYLEYIRKEIMNRIEYPFIAKRRGIEGKVWVAFIIKQDGNFKDINITKESPYSVLNDAVLKAIQNISVAKKPKEEIAVNIPIIFTLK